MTVENAKMLQVHRKRTIFVRAAGLAAAGYQPRSPHKKII